MHHAALTGQVGAVTLILQYGGCCDVESAFMETPLDVALQNPAGFLCVDTTKVVALLQSWELATEEVR